MEFKPFSLSKVNDMPFTKAKKYISKYFIILKNGEHIFLNDEQKHEIISDEILKRVYFKRMNKALRTWYFEEKDNLFKLVYELNASIFPRPNCINLCPQFLHEYDTAYDDFDDDVKAKVEFIIKHMNEVYCNNNPELLTYLLQWFSNMLQGKRSSSCLYFRGPQGAGKSTIIDDFIKNYVLGTSLTYQGGSGPLASKFNSELSGKAMVIFEELETFSQAQWSGVSTTLKRLITSETINIEKKGIDSIEQRNLNNYIILTNNDSIKDDNGRRYCIMDISTKYLDNDVYFDKLRSYYSLEVGKAFHAYLMELDMSTYNSLKFPKSQAKLDSYVKRMAHEYLFLKKRYILCKKSLKAPLSQLYQEYKEYCMDENLKPKHKIDFNNAMKNVGIHHNTKNVFNIPHVKLYEIAEKNKWIHYSDESEGVEEEEEEEEDEPLVKANLQEENEKLKAEIQRLKELYEQEEEEEEEEIIYPVKQIKKSKGIQFF